MIRYVHEGQMIPPWYGAFYREWQSNRLVCLPIGLNVIAGSIRAVYFILKGAPKWVRDNPRDAFQQGYRCGVESMIGAEEQTK